MHSVQPSPSDSIWGQRQCGNNRIFLIISITQRCVCLFPGCHLCGVLWHCFVDKAGKVNRVAERNGMFHCCLCVLVFARGWVGSACVVLS